MNFTRKIDRAFQWAGEKMGGEAKTAHSDEFKALEAEMNLRHDGVDRLQKSMNSYTKWAARRCDSAEDKERSTPTAFLGRTMTTHGEDFEQDSEFGNCLVTMGHANERLAILQENYAEAISATWLDNLEKNVAMMKEYSASRKKLENRRLAYDASTAKMQKARRDDFRVEEEVRMNKAKFEESSEEVLRRMQDIKEAEVDSVQALTSFVDAELDYHERAAEELRRARQSWAGLPAPPTIRHQNRSRSNTARSWQEPRQSAVFEEPEPPPMPARLPARLSPGTRAPPPPPPQPGRPSMAARATTSEGRAGPHLHQRVSPTPLSRIATDTGTYGPRDDVFTDDASTASGSGSPDWGERSARSTSPATSYGSLSRSTSALALKKAPPPPPPVNRAKKPAPPPVPGRKENLGY